MAQVQIILPDQSVREFDHPPTILEVAQNIGSGLAKATLGGMINGAKEVSDLRTVLKHGDQIKIITNKDPESLEVIRHSAAHLMAQAVQELWPDVKVTIGPVIDNGFYYDFDSPRPFTPEDLEKIEKKMKEIVKKADPVTREEWSSAQAIETFQKMGEHFKVEIIRDLGAETVSIYHQGKSWFDLCRGPHVQHMGQIKSFKVQSTAGAYWRGDQNNPQLQRVYATAFHDQKELEQYLHDLEEAKKRDHRKIGKELGLFMFNDVTPGSPFFHPKGTVVYNELVNYMRELYREFGYHEVITPQVFDVEMFKTSGHYQNYAENMYFTEIDENRTSAFKPMNCPSHCLMFAADKYSYRDLPYRIADFGRLHRFEKSGALHGLTRVRSMCQDDAHIFCTVDQVGEEIRKFMELLQKVYATLGMPRYKVLVATRPEKRMGSDEMWDKAEGGLFKALEDLNIPYEVSPGEGAFYGPKIEVHFVDAINRSWQLGTMQIDYNMPINFKLKYVADDNSEQVPVMLHRAVLGTLERFIGIYIEHTAGRFPLWLAPTQVTIMNVTDNQAEYCRDLGCELKNQGFRADVDVRNEKLGYKIREAQLQRVPYMLTIGDKEREAGTVSLRLRNGQTINNMPREAFLELLRRERGEKLLDSPLIEQNTNQEEGH